ncbi:(d)CMP kinase [Paracrocinitomix mangrovi]|uniref:(d)CMP kinase n=1 Tax=Paracrocinitomix mangrovi TaxID=2862509 RepID=UPI001C8D86B3|nr:(d)CMP kinase [Paracrocinitomix mangrovi]UKN01785.1 (d)CMP kinase [Paracrocinitomix mangrovi]
MSKITIAIDGYSSCGKSTLAKALANHLNYVYVDSGAMYRAITLHLINHGILKDGHFIKEKVIEELNDIDIRFEYNREQKKSETYLNGVNVEKDIRTLAISKQVSAISAIAEVRTKLVKIQQMMGAAGGVVMDGRDIGTVVFPNAEVKLFMVASNDIRAQRRFLELHDKGENLTLEEVKKSIARRDHLDMNREISPLQKADDAIEIDNSELTEVEQFQLALKIIDEKARSLQTAN